MSETSNPAKLRDEWLLRLNDLIQKVETWANSLNWATRRIKVTLNDSVVGSYQASALLLQHEAVRIMFEPIARSAPGADGVVDLYLMPAYDDIATFYFYDGQWRIQYMYPSPAEPELREVEFPLTFDVLSAVLNEMKQHHAVQ